MTGFQTGRIIPAAGRGGQAEGPGRKNEAFLKEADRGGLGDRLGLLLGVERLGGLPSLSRRRLLYPSFSPSNPDPSPS
jgi:hypothetical protein